MPFYRGSVDRYEVMATLLVIAIPFAAIGLMVATRAWARDAVTRARIPGLIGVGCTAVAAGNLFVARRCADLINRPVISVALGDGACYKSGLVAIQLVVLLVVATSAAVRVGEIRP